MSETAKHRHLIGHLLWGNVLDLGSGGDPVCPWAIQLELPSEQYHLYNMSRPEARVQWHGSALDLPFRDGTLDAVHSSHLLEDFPDWAPILAEWSRVLKPGGHLIIAVPDHDRFRAYVQRHLPVDVDNRSHRRESFVGDLTNWLVPMGYTMILDRFVNENPQEYSIVGAFRKNA